MIGYVRTVHGPLTSCTTCIPNYLTFIYHYTASYMIQL